jgi:hypothetical protein
MKERYDSVTSTSPTLPRWVKLGIRVLPFLTALVYGLLYEYDAFFLDRFGVSPEQAGTTYLKLLTRAGLIALVSFSIPALISLAIAFWTVSSLSLSTIERRLGALLVAAYLVSLLTSLVAHFTLWVNAVLVGLVIVTAMVLLLTHRRDESIVMAFFVIALVGVLGAFILISGRDAGKTASLSGDFPSELPYLGLDVDQVTPRWIDPNHRPVTLQQDDENRLRPTANGRVSPARDMLDLGENNGSVFLYDCKAQQTYRVPVADVVISYARSDHKQALECPQRSQRSKQ